MARRRRTSGVKGIVFGATVIALLLVALMRWGERKWGDAWPLPRLPGRSAGTPAADARPIYAGMPRSTGGAAGVTVLENQGFVIGYSERRQQPLWVCYRLFRVWPTNPPPPSNFQHDERTLAGVTEEDYHGSGYDRGHMAPNDAIADCYGAVAQRETFLMSNVCPQRPDFNRGVWKQLERLVARDYAERCEEVWVVCGPIFGPRPGRMRSGVELPEAFYKIVLDETAGGARRAIAWVIPQSARPQSRLDRYAASVDEVEARTGLDFFPDLPVEEEHAIEAEPGAMW